MLWVTLIALVGWLGAGAWRLALARRRAMREHARLAAASGPREECVAAQRYDDRAFSYNAARERWWVAPLARLLARRALPYEQLQGWDPAEGAAAGSGSGSAGGKRTTNQEKRSGL